MSKTTAPKKPAAATAPKRKYNKANYDNYRIFIPLHEKQRLKEIAAAEGISLNRYINDAINEKLEREGQKAMHRMSPPMMFKYNDEMQQRAYDAQKKKRQRLMDENAERHEKDKTAS